MEMNSVRDDEVRIVRGFFPCSYELVRRGVLYASCYLGAVCLVAGSPLVGWIFMGQERLTKKINSSDL